MLIQMSDFEMIDINHASFLSFIRTIRSFIDYSLSHNSTVTEENKRTTSPQNRHLLVHRTERSEKAVKLE